MELYRFVNRVLTFFNKGHLCFINAKQEMYFLTEKSLISLNLKWYIKKQAILEEDMKLGNSQRERLHDFMIKEGIILPSAPEDMPKSDPDSVPLGVKLTDDVIANDLSLKLLA
ncbi:hypothetical protein [Cytobacillus firmus]|uniref:hypothetical protein n=1 Tax=Cytobacillus firmus TaxID=1399 RepID=UPI0018CD1923|nr:hypothetical protein [Cytobacillus firmus]